MGLLKRFRTWLAGGLKEARRSSRRRIRASYDAAQTTAENTNHWAWADALSANAANSADVRAVLRERSRYETENNGYLSGLVDKLTNDLIGTGPRPQVRIPGVSREVTRRIETAFNQWARVVSLGEKLRLLDAAAIRDGEGFALFITNPLLPYDGVQLDLRLYECDQVDTPFLNLGDDFAFSGGRIDEHGNVTEYHFRKAHPGSDAWIAAYTDYEKIEASRVLHWFKCRRAGQLRGVPEMLSSLTLFAYLRRYTLATVVAAETAANFAGVLETDATADTSGGPTIETMDEIAMARGGLLTLPAGWRASQFKPEQPTGSYGGFKTEILTEAGAPLLAPRNVSTNTSADYNYSSGRLDYGLYHRALAVRRSSLCNRLLDRIFRAWLDEAAVVPGLIPDGVPPFSQWSWQWYFDGFTSMEPFKEAKAQESQLASKTITLAEIYAERGMDWEEALEQMATERKTQIELGLITEPAPARGASGGERTKADKPKPQEQEKAKGPAPKQTEAVESEVVPAEEALNGAQIKSLMDIILAISEGTITKDAAKALLKVAFPTVDPLKLEEIVDAAVVSEEVPA